MGLKQKLEREYVRGFMDGQQNVNEEMLKLAENHGYLKGSHETWRAIEAMLIEIPGVGVKTRGKVMRAIRERAGDDERV